MCIEPNANGTYTLKCSDGTTVTGSYKSVRHIADLLLDVYIRSCRKE